MFKTRDKFIPYRNSPLTKILKASISGSSRVALILCINPLARHSSETLSTLRLGVNAKKIVNKIQKNKGKTFGEKELARLIGEINQKIILLKNPLPSEGKSEEAEETLIRLEEQKRVFEQRLEDLVSKGLFRTKVNESLIRNIQEKKEHFLMRNVGLIQLPFIYKKISLENLLKGSFSFGGDSLISENQTSNQETQKHEERDLVLVKRIKHVERELNHKESEKSELQSKLLRLERKEFTLRQRNKKHRKEKKVSQKELKVLESILAFYHLKNEEPLEELDSSILESVEANLTKLLDNIKLEKQTRALRNSENVIIPTENVKNIRKRANEFEMKEVQKAFETVYERNLETRKGPGPKKVQLNEESLKRTPMLAQMELETPRKQEETQIQSFEARLAQIQENLRSIKKSITKPEDNRENQGFNPFNSFFFDRVSASQSTKGDFMSQKAFRIGLEDDEFFENKENGGNISNNHANPSQIGELKKRLSKEAEQVAHSHFLIQQGLIGRYY